MTYYHAPKKAFHKELGDIQWSLRYMAQNANNPLMRRTTGKRLEQEYTNLNVAQALHAMKKAAI